MFKALSYSALAASLALSGVAVAAQSKRDKAPGHDRVCLITFKNEAAVRGGAMWTSSGPRFCPERQPKPSRAAQRKSSLTEMTQRLLVSASTIPARGQPADAQSLVDQLQVAGRSSRRAWQRVRCRRRNQRQRIAFLSDARLVPSAPLRGPATLPRLSPPPDWGDFSSPPSANCGSRRVRRNERKRLTPDAIKDTAGQRDTS